MNSTNIFTDQVALGAGVIEAACRLVSPPAQPDQASLPTAPVEVKP
jgi:hypothetical protein